VVPGNNHRTDYMKTPKYLLWVLATLAGAQGALAQTNVFEDNFNENTNQGWTQPLSAFYATPPVMGFTNGVLRIQVPPATPETFATNAYSYATTALTNLSYSDFIEGVDVIATPANLFNLGGLYARFQGLQLDENGEQISGSGSGYLLATFHSPSGPTNQVLTLLRLDNEAINPAVNVQAVFPYVPGRQYRLILTGRGTHLVGQVWDLANSAAPLATVEAFDSAYTNGCAGLLAMDLLGFLHVANTPVDVTFDNFAIAAPAPLDTVAEDFDAGSDGNTQISHYDLWGSYGAPPARFTYTNGGLTITAPASVAPTQGAAFVGENLFAPTHADAVSSVGFWGWNGSANARPVFYLSARGNVVAPGVYSFYLLSVALTEFPEAPAGRNVQPNLSLVRVSNNTPQFPAMATTLITNVTLSASNHYHLVFSVQGNLLSGMLYQYPDLGSPIATVSTHDNLYSSGYFGFIATDNGDFASPRLNNPVQITVDNFSVVGTLPSPVLDVDRAVLLSWPATATGYVLESAPSLQGPWSAVDASLSQTNGTISGAVKTTAVAQFFRLRLSLFGE